MYGGSLSFTFILILILQIFTAISEKNDKDYVAPIIFSEYSN